MGLFDKLKNKVCCYALYSVEPILNMFHDIDDGMWQLLCNKAHTTDDTRIVVLQEAFDFDNSIGTLSHMHCGYLTRKNRNDHWVINKH